MEQLQLGRHPRVALYSHDAQGLGHVRRNLAIAEALHRMEPTPDILVLTGAAEAARLPRPPGCDVVTLPGMVKDESGDYGARNLTMRAHELVELRSAILAGAIGTFGPDLLIVDRHPRGFRGELEPVLSSLTGRTRIVLGLRDILDDPARAGLEWRRDRGTEALRSWYDQVWLYGDPTVHDLGDDIDLARADMPVIHTGYLGRGREVTGASANPLFSTPYILGLVGGGSDGAPLAASFVQARIPAGHHGLLVTGPQMPQNEVRQLQDAVNARPDLTLVRFSDQMESLIHHASAFVSMGGYNSVCEILPRRRPVLIVPRVHPRREQIVRAERLAALGVVDLLAPERLSGKAIGDWLQSTVGAGLLPTSSVDVDGLDALPGLAAALLGTRRLQEAGHVA